MPPTIAETLSRFDRKERHLVVQTCLGEPSLTLDGSFRETLAASLRPRFEGAIPAKAWWAIDYHLDWLAGALIWHAEHGRSDRDRPRKDCHELIRGNQEDIDLIVASGNDVILVEAKGHLSWDNSQLASKIARLGSLCDPAGTANGSHPERSVHLHFVLMSIRKPLKVECAGWPLWAMDTAGPFWMRMQSAGERLRVGRCDGLGKPNATGDHWRIWKKP